jgi:hypothetical protein
MRGTLFDAPLNEFYQKWRGEQQKARMPFVTILRAEAGQLADYTINTPPFPTQMPRLSTPPQRAEAMQEKLIEALHNPPPSTVPPLIITGKKPQPETTPAPRPQPAGVNAAAPAPAATAPGANNLPAATPPAPAVPPVEMAKTEAAPVAPARPSTEVTPQPSPAPVRVIEPKVEAVKGPETKPAPVPEPKPVVATAPVLAPPATQEVPGSAPSPRPSSLAPPPSSLPAPPAQTATAVPGETLARHRTLWIAGLVLAGVTASLAVLLLRRSRTAPPASLITRSFERKNKP